MVAIAYCFYSFDFRLCNSCRRRIGNCTFYLFYFLMNKKTKDIAIVLLGLSFLAYLFGSIVLLIIVLFLFLGVLLSERAIDFILFLWQKLANVLGYINTRIILFVFYFFVITPYSFLMKLFSSNKIMQKGVDSQFKNTVHLYKKSDFDNMW